MTKPGAVIKRVAIPAQDGMVDAFAPRAFQPIGVADVVRLYHRLQQPAEAFHG